MLNLLVVEDNERLRPALGAGLEHTGSVHIVGACGSGEEALAQCLAAQPDVVLMDVHLDGAMNGIEAAVAIRREFPRMPVVFYSIQTDESESTKCKSKGLPAFKPRQVSASS